jgi:hypothetical protein
VSLPLWHEVFGIGRERGFNKSGRCNTAKRDAMLTVRVWPPLTAFLAETVKEALRSVLGHRPGSAHKVKLVDITPNVTTNHDQRDWE